MNAQVTDTATPPVAVEATPCALDLLKIAYDALFDIITRSDYETEAGDAIVYAQDHIRTAVSYFQANSESHVALQIDAVRYKSTHVLELIDREQACEESRTVDRLLDKIGSYVSQASQSAA